MRWLLLPIFSSKARNHHPKSFKLSSYGILSATLGCWPRHLWGPLELVRRTGGHPGFTRRKKQGSLFLGSMQQKATQLLLGAHVSFQHWKRRHLQISPALHKSGYYTTLPASLLLHRNLLSLRRCLKDWNVLLFWNVNKRGCCFNVLVLLYPQTPQGSHLAPPQRGCLEHSLGCAGHSYGEGGR